MELSWIDIPDRYSAGLDDAAAMELMSANSSGASAALAAHEARKAAREREGRTINAALHNLEKVSQLTKSCLPSDVNHGQRLRIALE